MNKDQGQFHWAGNHEPEKPGGEGNEKNIPRLKNERGLKHEVVIFMNSTIPADSSEYINN